MNTSVFPLVITVIFAHFLALLSPGPDFMLLVKSGIRNRLRSALGLSVGIACANAVYILLCIIGLGEFLTKSLFLLRLVKASGGVFLLYIAVSALKSGKEKYHFKQEIQTSTGGKEKFHSEFLAGFLSGITNPKNLVFYLSLFSMVLSAGTGKGLKIGLGVWMTCLVFFWDSMILMVLSREPVRKAFSGVVYYIDKTAGIIIAGLGVKLIISAVKDHSI